MPITELYSPTIFPSDIEMLSLEKRHVYFINPISLDTDPTKGLFNVYNEFVGGGLGDSVLSWLKESPKTIGATHLWKVEDHTSDELLKLKNVTVITIVTKYSFKNAPDLNKLKNILKTLKELIEKLPKGAIVLSPLLGCGQGQLTYTTVAEETYKQFKDINQNVIFSLHPNNRHKLSRRTLTFVWDGAEFKKETLAYIQKSLDDAVVFKDVDSEGPLQIVVVSKGRDKNYDQYVETLKTKYPDAIVHKYRNTNKSSFDCIAQFFIRHSDGIMYLYKRSKESSIRTGKTIRSYKPRGDIYTVRY